MIEGAKTLKLGNTSNEKLHPSRGVILSYKNVNYQTNGKKKNTESDTTICKHCTYTLFLFLPSIIPHLRTIFLIYAHLRSAKNHATSEALHLSYLQKMTCLFGGKRD